jgi:CRISPR-associated endonuclease/helicase Cas3
MIDTGIVTRRLLVSMPEGFRERFHAEFTDDPTLSVDWIIAFFACLHDLGKISPGFQGKREDLFERLRLLGFPPLKSIDETRHGQVLLDVLPDLLEKELECPEEAAL